MPHSLDIQENIFVIKSVYECLGINIYMWIRMIENS